MAKATKNLALPTVLSPSTNSPEIELLHFNQRANRCFLDTRTHSHPFWQLEIFTGGVAHFTSDHCDEQLTAGDTLLIAPDTCHSFSYKPDGASFLSFKFYWSGNLPGAVLVRKEDELVRDFCALLTGLIEKAASDAGVYCSLCGVVGSLAEYISRKLTFDEERNLNAHSGFINEIRHIIRSHAGGRLTVSELARLVGFSPNYISSEFARRTSERLKDAIDGARAESAARLLAYEDMSVEEISQQLDFPDIFSFSRFFKRVKGVSPREYRRKSREG